MDDGEEEERKDDRPTLQAVVLDFSSVNNIDVTATQALIDVRNQLDRHAAPNTVDWHFANIENRWTKRALAAAGFGYGTPPARPGGHGAGQWRTIFSIADLGGSDSAAQAAAAEMGPGDVETGGGRLVAVQGMNRPYFHFDLQEAVEAAMMKLEREG